MGNMQNSEKSEEMSKSKKYQKKESRIDKKTMMMNQNPQKKNPSLIQTKTYSKV